MGPVTIAVDSYGPVTDNAQSRLRALVIETIPGIKDEIKKRLRLRRRLREGQALPRGERRRRQHLQGHRQAGAHRHRRRRRHDDDLLDHHAPDRGPHDQHREALDPPPPFLLGLIAAARSSTGSPAPRCRPSPRAPTARSSSSRRTSSSTASRRPRSRTARRSSRSARSTRRRGCSTSSSTVFFITLAFACLEPFFFIGYLISIALFGLFQAHLHGQRRRRLGQREEDRRGRAEGEGHAAARRVRRRRHGRRSLQGHVVASR
jgi:K(+)-stimulated pyrophosphate-energized sodium pump